MSVKTGAPAKRAKRAKRGPNLTFKTSRLTIPARASEAGLSTRAFQMEIEAGRGPKLTYVSPRRRIIQAEDMAAWLRERRDNPPPEVTAKQGRKAVAIAQTSATAP
jgi:hypothetical protein